MEHSAVCPSCGHATAVVQAPARRSALSIVAMVFMIVSTVYHGFFIFPLAWYLPMTITYCRKVRNNQPVSVGFKVCSLIFVDLVSGILMLCDHSHDRQCA